MIDTVIKIGKLYRQAPKYWHYHRQINQIITDVKSLLKKKDKQGNSIETVFKEISVTEKDDNLFFDFENITEIVDQDKNDSLFYLNFKTSDKDSEKRYLFGDVIYSGYIDKAGEFQENGNYRMQGEKKKSSFFRCEENAEKMDLPFLQKFRSEFRKNIEKIENILKSANSVVLHFDFSGKNWFEIEGLIQKIDENIVTGFVTEIANSENCILDKYLYKTLGGVTPGFTEEAKYKNKVFLKDDIISLIYAVGVYQKPLLRINNVGVVALPHSENLKSEHIVNFFDRNNDKDVLDTEESKEETINQDLENELNSDSDDFFKEFVINDLEDTVKFDIIFSSIPKSPAGVFSDLIEISNIQKSFLVQTHEKIRKVEKIIANEANTKFPNAKKPFHFNLRYSFLKIIGDATKDKKKYQFHLLKILPQIYTDTYYQDPVLLPVFIEKVQNNIRQSGQGFATLKYDFYFLMKIQKNDNLMKITESKSYLLGKSLGTLARPFAAWRGDDCPIKSFEKTYVGNLSRHISSMEGAQKLAIFLNQKLTFHIDPKKMIFNKKAYLDFIEVVKSFQDEKYNKNNCALGFFESYYYFEANTDKKTENENAENEIINQ